REHAPRNGGYKYDKTSTEYTAQLPALGQSEYANDGTTLWLSSYGSRTPSRVGCKPVHAAVDDSDVPALVYLRGVVDSLQPGKNLLCPFGIRQTYVLGGHLLDVVLPPPRKYTMFLRSVQPSTESVILSASLRTTREIFKTMCISTDWIASGMAVLF
ncbi:unnamed protein product, partial [Aureobasidium pullulans]